MAWYAVDCLSEGHEGVVGGRVCVLLEGVSPELREKRTFGDGTRCC
jgi:hypothetical protein